MTKNACDECFRTRPTRTYHTQTKSADDWDHATTDLCSSCSKKFQKASWIKLGVPTQGGTIQEVHPL